MVLLCLLNRMQTLQHKTRALCMFSFSCHPKLLSYFSHTHNLSSNETQLMIPLQFSAHAYQHIIDYTILCVGNAHASSLPYFCPPFKVQLCYHLHICFLHLFHLTILLSFFKFVSFSSLPSCDIKYILTFIIGGVYVFYYTIWMHILHPTILYTP